MAWRSRQQRTILPHQRDSPCHTHVNTASAVRFVINRTSVTFSVDECVYGMLLQESEDKCERVRVSTHTTHIRHTHDEGCPASAAASHHPTPRDWAAAWLRITTSRPPKRGSRVRGHFRSSWGPGTRHHPSLQVRSPSLPREG